MSHIVPKPVPLILRKVQIRHPLGWGSHLMMQNSCHLLRVQQGNQQGEFCGGSTFAGVGSVVWELSVTVKERGYWELLVVAEEKQDCWEAGC